MTQKFAKLVVMPVGPAPDEVKEQIVGLIFPKLSGFFKSHFEDSHGILDEENKVNIAGADFVNTILRHENGRNIYDEYVKVFGQLEAMLITFNKDECKEFSF